MNALREPLEQTLMRHFGHQTFRPGQREIVERLLVGRNVLGLIATGGGKSLAYQLPSLLLPGVTLVVSPLISLMVDQVQKLRQKGRRDVAYLNSALSGAEARQVLDELVQGRYRLLYISPEKLMQPQVCRLIRQRGVSLVAVDEAHCISQWGHDFRTDYLRLPDVVAALGSPPVLAVTATATRAVREEICRLFSIRPQDVVAQPLNRPNLAYDLIPVASESDKRQRLREMLDTLQGPGIVYCGTRQAVEQLVAECLASGVERVYGYHGGMSGVERVLIQEQFLRGELDVIIATNAFGMGIDKADIRFVLHYHLPSSVEAYVQEVGRIGRDGLPGYACLFYSPEDAAIHHRLLANEFPGPSEVEGFLRTIGQFGQTDAEISYLELHEWAGVGETMARTLFFYAEQARLVADVVQTRNGFRFTRKAQEVAAVRSWMLRELDQTRQTKLAKLRQMQEWAEGSGCLRAGLAAYFDESEPGESLADCCCRCGLNLERYRAERVRAASSEAPPWDLRQALRNLLPPLRVQKEEDVS